MNDLSPEQKMLYSVFGRASEGPEDGTLGDIADAIFAGCCEVADAIRESGRRRDAFYEGLQLGNITLPVEVFDGIQ